jgi:hypothetical protein
MATLTGGRAAIMKGAREALRAVIAAVPGCENVFTRRRDHRVKSKWDALTDYTYPNGRVTKRAFFITPAGFEDLSTVEQCIKLKLHFRIRYYESYYDGTDDDNSTDGIDKAIGDLADAIGAQIKIGYDNVRRERVQQPTEPLMDPFDTGFKEMAHLGDLFIELRVN